MFHEIERPDGEVREFTMRTIDAGLENCIVAAIKMPDGYAVRGHRHCHCLSAAGAMPRYADVNLHRVEQGFITSWGRFVDRIEGRRLQEAAGYPSVAKGGYRGDELYSEDLY